MDVVLQTMALPFTKRRWEEGQAWGQGEVPVRRPLTPPALIQPGA